ncbi:hypothetical protein [Xylella taiwanensis]|uniref:hypothetical protein n=1 Tax=Xylella taiwanensis TaxID=1444770 RepID=UPI003CE4E84D
MLGWKGGAAYIVKHHAASLRNVSCSSKAACRSAWRIRSSSHSYTPRHVLMYAAASPPIATARRQSLIATTPLPWPIKNQTM